MDRSEILPMIARFIQKRGYKTSPYVLSMDHDFAFIVWMDNIRLGTVDFIEERILFYAEDSGHGSPYYYNPYDPNSFPDLIEQINAIRILRRGIK